MKQRSLRVGLLILLSMVLLEGATSNYIKVLKKGVWYTFVPFDKITDRWVRNVFPYWEQSTFDVFDTVKDPQGIAIDLGAWIGTTAIWLSQHFSHVVAIDADRVSLQCLRNNLQASGCTNVAVCAFPVADKEKDVVFGPRGQQKLNDSMSCIKETPYAPDDYVVRAITFNQLIHDYIEVHEQLKTQKISFIKCDIEGGEESIIEDILSFAYQHNIKVYLSFHLEWWTSKKITDFEPLFTLFKTDCPQEDICQYIKQNPYASILFEPK